jgi:DNA polymerase
MLAWLAREQWRMDAFERGDDIYCASASRMFGVPVVKHGINGDLRQKGKVAELALGYGGSVGALKAMGALEMGLSEEELQPLVNTWRSANGALSLHSGGRSTMP